MVVVSAITYSWENVSYTFFQAGRTLCEGGLHAAICHLHELLKLDLVANLVAKAASELAVALAPAQVVDEPRLVVEWKAQ